MLILSQYRFAIALLGKLESRHRLLQRRDYFNTLNYLNLQILAMRIGLFEDCIYSPFDREVVDIWVTGTPAAVDHLEPVRFRTC